MRTHTSLIAVSVLTMLALSTPAHAQTAQAYSKESILHLINTGNAETAYRILSPQMGARVNDPTYNYLLGLAALDAGHTVEAIQSLERTLTLEPGNLPARAEIARAYLKAGDIDTAKRELEIVKSQPTVPQQVRDTMLDVVSEINSINDGGGTLVNGYVETGGGYDSNVNTATADTTMVIPLFAGLGPARLNDDARETSSYFMRNTANLNVTHGIDRQMRAIGSLTASDSRYFSKHDFDQTDVTARAGVAYLLKDRSLLTADLTGQHVRLDDEGYRWMVGPSLAYERALTPEWRAGGFAQAYAIYYPDMSGRDGYRYSVGAGASRAIPSLWGGGVNMSGYLGTETVDDTAFEHLAYDFYGARLGVEATPIAKLTNFATASLEQRNYDRSDPLFLQKRDDTQFDASVGSVYRFTPELSLRGQIGYTYNDSNIDLYEYDRWTAGAFARYGF